MVIRGLQLEPQFELIEGSGGENYYCAKCSSAGNKKNALLKS
jgi:hypothetical protein